MSPETHITNLLYRYAELMDAGDLEAVAALFTHADVTLGGGQVVHGAAPMLEQWRAFVRIHACGTPRTKHVITNAIVEVDADAGTAACRSYYTVFQQTDTLPLQAICAGRYHDTFARVDGVWRFATRDYSLLDMIGDLSQHLLLPVPAPTL
ncbi:nuclear transport factor 2 family protein [Novosphingobium sp.]|uniref:nuclear transport factor 2 family protein n=1 Tax=Novosphingobium sp. TaxID=1874826 RepID=UPI0033415059